MADDKPIMWKIGKPIRVLWSKNATSCSTSYFTHKSPGFFTVQSCFHWTSSHTCCCTWQWEDLNCQSLGRQKKGAARSTKSPQPGAAKEQSLCGVLDLQPARPQSQPAFFRQSEEERELKLYDSFEFYDTRSPCPTRFGQALSFTPLVVYPSHMKYRKMNIHNRTRPVWSACVYCRSTCLLHSWVTVTATLAECGLWSLLRKIVEGLIQGGGITNVQERTRAGRQLKNNPTVEMKEAAVVLQSCRKMHQIGSI